MRRQRKAQIGIALLSLGLFALPAISQASPRSDIDLRIDNMNLRIDHAQDAGRLSPWQARRLHTQVQTIKHNENVDLYNDGYITDDSFHDLNSQLDTVAHNFRVYAGNFGDDVDHDLD